MPATQDTVIYIKTQSNEYFRTLVTWQFIKRNPPLITLPNIPPCYIVGENMTTQQCNTILSYKPPRKITEQDWPLNPQRNTKPQRYQYNYNTTQNPTHPHEVLDTAYNTPFSIAQFYNLQDAQHYIDYLNTHQPANSASAR